MFIFMYLFLVYLINIPSIGGIIQDFYWRDYVYGDIPCDAFEGAPGKYIGQFNFKGHNLVGTIYTNSRSAVAEYGGKQSTRDDIKILCSPDIHRFYWEFVDLQKPADKQMQDAVKGGFVEVEHYQIFIGKTMHDSEWKIGKVHGFEVPHVTGLWIWDKDGKSVRGQQIFILKYNTTNACSKQCSSCTAV